MGEIRLTARAEADLAGIADYTIETFGIEQARRYRDDLEGCFRTIAENPRLGRSAEALAAGQGFLHIGFRHANRGQLLIRRQSAQLRAQRPRRSTITDRGQRSDRLSHHSTGVTSPMRGNASKSARSAMDVSTRANGAPRQK